MFNDPTLRIFYALSEGNQVMKNEYKNTLDLSNLNNIADFYYISKYLECYKTY